MDIFVVQGGKKLEGSITVGGAKNAAVAIIPAAILSGDICRIENLPTISDVEVISKILVQLGGLVVCAVHGIDLRHVGPKAALILVCSYIHKRTVKIENIILVHSFTLLSGNIFLSHCFIVSF